MTNLPKLPELSKNQILGLAAVAATAVSGLVGFLAGKQQPRPWTKTDHAIAYYQGYADGMNGKQNHEYQMKELETRPEVVEKVVKVPVPEKQTPMVMMAKAIEAWNDARSNENDEDNEEEEDE